MIEVLKPGIYCSVQDAGRLGFRNQGVPLSGAMDGRSATYANLLAGNPLDSALIEFASPGPVFRFHKNCHIAVCGADFEVQVNGINHSMNTQISISKTDEVFIGRAATGVWGYLAVSGGIASETVLGSRSFYSGITSEPRLIGGSKVSIGKAAENREPDLLPEPHDRLLKSPIKAYPGPEFSKLTSEVQHALFTTQFTISAQSNRMAYILEYSNRLKAEEILTAPVRPGTVQLTPSGKMVVLMRDAQTTGGYARVLQLSERSIDSLAQKAASTEIIFSRIDY